MNRMMMVVRSIPHQLRHHGTVLGTTTTSWHGPRRISSLTSRSVTTTVASSSRITLSSSRIVVPTATAAVVVAIVTASLSIRQWRQEQIRVQLPLYQPQIVNQRLSTEALTSTIQRAGLMKGRPPSYYQVHDGEDDATQHQPLEELQSIRQWHLQHGYHGAIVVWDIATTTPSYPNKSNNPLDPTTHQNDRRPRGSSVVQQVGHQWQQYTQQLNLARRECYYIYYEICPVTGQTTLQIYIRGTALWIDIVTCLLTYMIYDTELSCHVHYGFRQHAHRILQDILPLLSTHARIELCGHSLGGAVASILAMILHVRGYPVTKLTTIGEPAYLWFPPEYRDSHVYGTIWRSILGSKMSGTATTTDSKMSHSGNHRDHVRSLLPRDQLRIENDCDIVPYLPPFGSHVGNKIWITRTGTGSPFDSPTKVCWVDASSPLVPFTTTVTTTTNEHDPPQTQSHKSRSSDWWWWTESIWINLCVPELYARYRMSHRLSNYIKHLRLEEDDDDDDGATKSK